MNGELGKLVLDDAVVYPTMRHEDHPGVLLMGVRARDGDFPPDGLQQRRSTEPGAPMPEAFFPEEPEYVPGEHLYAGVLYHHFGHFLLESLAKLWAAPDHPDAPIVWAGAHTWVDFRLRPWQNDVISVLGLPNPSVCLYRPMRFERLIVPRSGYHYDDAFHPDHARFLAKYEGPPPDPAKKLWLTRAQFSANRDRGAAHLDRRLADAGWTVAAPENHRLREQLDMLSSASQVAGEEGSALHLPILLKSHKGRRYDIFKRTETVHRNFLTIGNRIGMEQHFHGLSTQRVVSHAGRAIQKVSANTSEALNLLRVPPQGPAPTETPSLIGRIASWIVSERPIDRCLDAAPGDAPPIWLSPERERPAKQDEDEADDRAEQGPPTAGGLDLVRGHFDFDPRTTPEIGAFEMDPEIFFSRFVDDVRYDLFLMDGRDHERALRAFAASIAAALPKAIWLFDAEDDAGSYAIANAAAEAARTKALAAADPLGAPAGAPRAEAPAAAPTPDHVRLAFRMQELFPSMTVKTITIGKTPMIAAVNLPMPQYAPVFFGDAPEADFAAAARLAYESTLKAWLRNSGWLDVRRRAPKFSFRKLFSRT